MTLDFPDARRRMVQAQLIRRGIEDAAVLRAMGAVRRELFVPEELRDMAYEDAPLPIGESQTISQPYVVALMLEAAEIEPGHRVLEVGVGSGYAAAVMSCIAGRVFAIERHAALVDAARKNLAAAAHDNVEVRLGDGTRGWAEAAPFDAIIVSAGGPSIPHALAEQLEIGGRLVIPVGEQGAQRLLRVVRLAAGRYEEEDLGHVAFVPLVGEHGWAEDGAARSGRSSLTDEQAAARLAEPLPEIDSEGFAETFDRFGDRRVVLLGEATHGTSDFYRARAAITRRLVERHGFTVVAVEADWPDAAVVNRSIRDLPPLRGQEPPFLRFPRWMWRNEEMVRFLAWLRHHNGSNADAGAAAGFYGLDLYNMTAAISTVLAHLDEVDPAAAAVARERYGCLMPWQRDPAAYARSALTPGYRSCEREAVAQCRELLASRLAFEPAGGDSFLDASQSARLVASAEEYYRTLYYGGAASWNLRDRHMFETLRGVLDARGAGTKAVVWAHNSHIGDARATEMGRSRGELSLGQLCREHFGDEAALVGFGTDRGTVVAADDWDGPMQVMSVRPSAEGSWENLCHRASPPRALLDFGREAGLSDELSRPRQQRFIGVVYRSGTERQSHYLEASAASQYDAYVWLDETRALRPTDTGGQPRGIPDTYPFGV